MSGSLTQLVDLLRSSADVLEKACAANGTSIPNINQPFTPSSEAFRKDPVVAEAATVVTAAATQLAAIVNPPHVSLYHCAGGVSKLLFLRS